MWVFIPGKKLETTQVFINRRVGEPIVAYLHHERPLSNENKNIDTFSHMDESPNNYAEWKKPDKKEYILYDPIFIKL